MDTDMIMDLTKERRGLRHRRSEYHQSAAKSGHVLIATSYPRRDWRDWFIMATVTSGVGYGLYTVAKVPFLPKKKTNLTLTLPQRYVLPLISPPTPPQLEADKASIDASFNGAFALIDQLATDTAELKEKETQRTEKLDTTLKGVDAVIEDLKEANKRRDVENRIIVDQIDGLKDQVPKALEGWKASGDAKLEELSQEMQSLKRLLENRVGRSGGTSKSTGKHSTPTAANENENAKDITSSPTSNNLVTGTPNSESPSTTSVPAPGITAPKQNDRKAIPAWQRAASEKSSNAASAGNSETSKAEAGA